MKRSTVLTVGKFEPGVEYKGIVLSYNHEKGMGFIGQDLYACKGIYFHARDVIRPFRAVGLQTGDEVLHHAAESRKFKGEMMAVNVRRIQGAE